MRAQALISISRVNGLRIRAVFFIAVFWTCVDFVISILSEDTQARANSLGFREAMIFVLSLMMGYIFVFHLRKVLVHYPLWASFLGKSLILLFSAFFLTFLIQFLNSILILKESAGIAFIAIKEYALHKNWLVRKIVYWASIFFVTQLLLIINEKYSPGVFIDILLGKYVNPKNENRIIMFMDLKDSTPIAEKLGHSLYFEFIREFIFQVSVAIIEFDGTIYQYVGDEVVCSWKNTEKNTVRCLDAIMQSRKNISRRKKYFKKKYGIMPEFRVGINVGEVTVGEIGVIKKDIAMSGDTMNTTARIRSACNELNHHFIVSKDFIDASRLTSGQSQSLGMVDLKGKKHEIELFSLNI
jgi:adenylate cyclase